MPPADDEKTRLRALDKELASADAEFEHHLRRYGDQLERSGSDWGFAGEVARLKKNRKSIARERAGIAVRLERLQSF